MIMYKKYIKRLMDIVLSAILMIMASIPMAVLAGLIRRESEGDAIFKQKRLGKNGRVFTLYKFRSMCVGAEKIGTGVYSEKGDTRVTKLGRILRATSLDELPQLWNILKGDMSFIGPRPPLTYHPWTIENYTEEQRRMFDVRPGITGWAQINGRKAVEWNRRIKLNVWYVDNVTFKTDIKIFFVTILKVLRNDDNENMGATVTDKNSVAE